MVQRIEDSVYKPITEYTKVFSDFKEPDVPRKSPKNFTMHTDPRVEEYFKYVAFRGRTDIEWAKIRSAFLWKLKSAIEDMRERTTEDKMIPGKDDENSLKQIFDFVTSRAEAFEDAPFTFQRICELLIEPDRHYNTVGKYLRALEKTINVNTCIFPNGTRITNADEMETEEPAIDDERVENTFIDVKVDELEMDGANDESSLSVNSINGQINSNSTTNKL
ncbi:hypothetical protein M3Y97_01083500 [Aphelenchoides bicaudatus]|nr:hypothetical protein M3Y97_01083500 [Aphelenchoides bicaudatus]